jgi:hypothetical protein
VRLPLPLRVNGFSRTAAPSRHGKRVASSDGVALPPRPPGSVVSGFRGARHANALRQPERVAANGVEFHADGAGSLEPELEWRAPRTGPQISRGPGGASA